MTEGHIPLHSLVIYKGRPGRVTQTGKKLEIEMEDGRALSVRPKDILPIHPGPVRSLTELQPLAGDVVAVWELLAGETTTLAELADLIFGAFTPAAAWATWQLLEDGLYFRGDLEGITAQSAEEVAQVTAVRAAKETERQAWEAFLSRLAQHTYASEDAAYLNEVAALALKRQERSRVMRALNRSETPETAHALLLSLGYWDMLVNPYPARLGVAVTLPDMPLPPLPAEERRDLTHLPALAIDDEGNQDPDDALSWEEENGRLWVHIADVSALILPDSPADREARQRGATLYLPEGTIPMLPLAAMQELGLGLVEISPALSFALRLSAAGEVALEEVTPSWVRVTRLTYAQAETQLTEEPLATLLRLADVFQARRVAGAADCAGAVELSLPEVRVRVIEGVVEIRPLPPLRSRDLVREAMLMTGEAVARFALAQQIPLLFTTQDPPLPAENLPDGLAGDFARRKTMQRSQPSRLPGAHAGLGLPMYVQCTSPLRRYLDLVAHQQLRAWLRGEALLDERALLERMGTADAGGADVRLTERLSLAHWTLVYLYQNPTWRGEGVVVERKGKQSVVLIPELAWDGEVFGRGERPLNSTWQLQVQSLQLPDREVRFREV